MAEGLTEGERWAREALGELRARRFGPVAWIRFLAASFRRSGDDARRRPDLLRQSLVLGAVGLIPWIGLVALDRDALWGAAWWAAVVAMLAWHLGMVEGLGGERRDGLGPATALTLLRAWLVPALPLAAGAPALFAALFALGAVADGVDGPLARRRGEVTRLGAQTDGAVDTAFALAAAWTAVGAGWLGAWAGILVTARYVLPPLLIALFYFARAAAPPRDAFVPGRLPGLAVALGLALAPLDALRPVAVALLALGLAGGAVTAAVSITRVFRTSGPPAADAPGSMT